MTTTITTAARRIARAANAAGPVLSGGFLAFDEKGHGGEWYSADSRPNVVIRYPVPDVYVTQREVQDWLDAQLVV